MAAILNVNTPATQAGPAAQLAQSSSAEVLRCEAVSAFYGRIQVVFDVSLAIRAGECLTVLGANGAGKTSLLGAISGTVRGTGRMLFDSRDLAGMSAHRRAKLGVSYVPEARRNLFPSMTVRENLDIGLSLSAPGVRSEVLDFVVRLFPILRERMSTMAGMLSGGEQQMLAIAVALGRRPSVLILDEPSQGLAPAIFDILEGAFTQLKNRHIGILLAEQNLAFASQVADRYMVISHGHVALEGGRDDIRDHDQIFAAYMSGDA
jgi:branched-chain amino acid transport system ATP-binding protein